MNHLLTRRETLARLGGGFGGLVLNCLLGDALAADKGGPAVYDLTPRQPHFRPRAKRIIFLFMQGSLSQMDTWEYKPVLQRSDGQVGPGGGILTAELVRAGYDVLGVDYSAALLRIARRRVSAARFRRASFLEVDLPACGRPRCKTACPGGTVPG